MKENLFSIIIALALASVIFFGLLMNFDNFDTLQNNVIWTEQEQLFGDIVLDTYKDRIEVIANKDIPWVAAMSIMILWDQEVALPEFTWVSSVGNTELTQEFEWRVTVFINQLVGISKDDILLTLPVWWDVAQISVSDIVLLFDDNSSERASISTRL